MLHVRACLWITTDQGSITFPRQHPVCLAHAVCSHRRSPCFIKRSIHRLADKDPIRTVREDRDTQRQKHESDKERRMSRSLVLGNAWRRKMPNHQEFKKKKKRKNTKKPVYPEQRVIMSKTVYRMSKGKKKNSMIMRDNIQFLFFQTTVKCIPFSSIIKKKKKSKSKPFSLVKRKSLCWGKNKGTGLEKIWVGILHHKHTNEGFCSH